MRKFKTFYGERGQDFTAINEWIDKEHARVISFTIIAYGDMNERVVVLYEYDNIAEICN